ncbi:MAG TPA: zinc transporter ZupT [Candidatus Ornithomonoglobus intestinigallinarum]|uniref:Zinc transporter ZupT n=1 Tax=Candidatus Ornithomonoglobus intestinigallinarum TaxID=2840894 RepID=A0A9D1H291_9FIRM|nr:zinc transporter ZupT [Candidatus Ornithomonoglobus intestinigallinarum]
MSSIIFALSLTLMAGASTGIGGVMSLFAKKTNTRFLAASLGFSAGVMIYVSMVEIFMKSRDYLTACAGARTGCVIAALSFFAGMIFIGVIDFLVPSAEGDIGNLRAGEKREMRLSRMGIMTALAIGIHNFPEGLATFTSALKEPQLGVAIAAAIAIHNIPEGIATAVPIYFSTGSKKKAFWVSLLSGMAEPVGAVMGYMLLRNFFNDFTFGILFGAVAGIMVFISVEELLPTAREYEKSKATIIGFSAGMAVIAASLLLFM